MLSAPPHSSAAERGREGVTEGGEAPMLKWRRRVGSLRDGGGKGGGSEPGLPGSSGRQYSFGLLPDVKIKMLVVRGT